MLDTSSSASRQHYIDTGFYLEEGEAWELCDGSDFHEGDYGDDESWLPHATEDELPGIYGGNGYSIIRDEEL